MKEEEEEEERQETTSSQIRIRYKPRHTVKRSQDDQNFSFSDINACKL